MKNDGDTAHTASITADGNTMINQSPPSSSQSEYFLKYFRGFGNCSCSCRKTVLMIS